MLVLVLKFSRINASTLYPVTNLRDRGTSRCKRPFFRALHKGTASRSSKTEDESSDLSHYHLTGTRDKSQDIPRCYRTVTD